MGTPPRSDGGLPDTSCNGPVGKFALALEMRRRGFRTVYPRAIHTTGGPEWPLIRELLRRAERLLLSKSV